MSPTPGSDPGRSRPPRWLVAAATGLLVVTAACGSESTDPPPAPSTTPPETTIAPATTEAPGSTDESESTSAPATTALATTSTSTAPTTAPRPTTTTTPASTPDPAVPGPGSSGCRTTAGPVVLITLTDPMPGPDYCMEIRQSQSLEVVNESAAVATLSIFQGSAENVFDTPPLASGERFASEAVGEVFPTGEWLLEVSSITGWLGTLWVVSD